ncbi:MAG TPA: DUF5684 domain-containing protein [Gemmatimonadaceae bacterium]|nr:DUF5684 domain-containing protein [Gemmatimonadaceae bacterium]
MSTYAALLALQGTDAPAAGGLALWLVIMGLVVFMVASMWIVFDKAGQPGWAVLIPIYQQIVHARVANKSVWWGIALIIPVINLIAYFVISFGVAERFGKSTAFGIGLALLPIVFYPMLAFGDAQAEPMFA